MPDAVAGREAVHPAAFRQQIGDQHNRAIDRLQRFAHAFHQEDRHQACVEAARADQHRVEIPDRRVDSGMNFHRRLEPGPLHELAAALAEVHFHLAARVGAVAVLGAHARRLDGDGPDVSGAAEQRPQAVDG